MKYAWMDAHRRLFALTEMCPVLEVSISGYRAWQRGGTPHRQRLTDVQLLAVICAIHAEIKGAYGSPRMVRALRLRGLTAGKERVERLMREHGIRAQHKRRYKVTTDSKHGLPVAPNLLARQFTPAAPSLPAAPCGPAGPTGPTGPCAPAAPSTPCHWSSQTRHYYAQTSAAQRAPR